MKIIILSIVLLVLPSCSWAFCDVGTSMEKYLRCQEREEYIKKQMDFQEDLMEIQREELDIQRKRLEFEESEALKQELKGI